MLTKIHRQRISMALKGRISPLKGKKLTQEHKKKLSGENNHFWKGGRHIAKKGYVMIKDRTHPYHNNKGYVFEHRIVMEKSLKRYLLPHEQVHHRNGIKNDNRLENLEVVLRTTHFGKVCCPRCQFEFKIK